MTIRKLAFALAFGSCCSWGLFASPLRVPESHYVQSSFFECGHLRASHWQPIEAEIRTKGTINV